MEIDEKHIKKYELQIKSALNIDLKLYKKKYGKHFEFNKRNKLVGNNVSGKYILYFVKAYISNKFSLSSIPDDAFYYRICQYCIFSSLSSVQKRIQSYLNI